MGRKIGRATDGIGDVTWDSRRGCCREGFRTRDLHDRRKRASFIGQGIFAQGFEGADADGSPLKLVMTASQPVALRAQPTCWRICLFTNGSSLTVAIAPTYLGTCCKKACCKKETSPSASWQNVRRQSRGHRQTRLSARQTGSVHVRSTERRAPHRHPQRQVRRDFPRYRRARRDRHIPALRSIRWRP